MDSKDEVVFACTEKAAVRLEDRFITPAFNDLTDLHRLTKIKKDRADEMAPTIKLLAQAGLTSKYRPQMEPALSRLCERYEHYADEIADNLTVM